MSATYVLNRDHSRANKRLEHRSQPLNNDQSLAITVIENRSQPRDHSPVNCLWRCFGDDQRDEGFGLIDTTTRLRQKSFVRQKDAKLYNCPCTVQYMYINDGIWSCQTDGTVRICDRNLKCFRTLSDQQWGDVRDVTKLVNGDVV